MNTTKHECMLLFKKVLKPMTDKSRYKVYRCAMQ